MLSGRSLVPPAFVVSLVVLAPAALRSPAARRLLTAEVGAYAGCTLAFAAASLGRRREPWRLFPRVVAVFPTFHVAYGLGVLHGFVRAAGAAATDEGRLSGPARSRSARGRARRSA